MSLWFTPRKILLVHIPAFYQHFARGQDTGAVQGSAEPCTCYFYSLFPSEGVNYEVLQQWNSWSCFPSAPPGSGTGFVQLQPPFGQIKSGAALCILWGKAALELPLCATAFPEQGGQSWHLLNGKIVMERILAEIWGLAKLSSASSVPVRTVLRFLPFSVHLGRATAAPLFLT